MDTRGLHRYFELLQHLEGMPAEELNSKEAIIIASLEEERSISVLQGGVVNLNELRDKIKE